LTVQVEAIALEVIELQKEADSMEQQVRKHLLQRSCTALIHRPCVEQLVDRKAGLAASEEQLTELEKVASQRKQKYEGAKGELDSRRQLISDCEKDIVKLSKVRCCHCAVHSSACDLTPGCRHGTRPRKSWRKRS
jgi:chromosome segregation ATPase